MKLGKSASIGEIHLDRKTDSMTACNIIVYFFGAIKENILIIGDCPDDLVIVSSRKLQKKCKEFGIKFSQAQFDLAFSSKKSLEYDGYKISISFPDEILYLSPDDEE